MGISVQCVLTTVFLFRSIHINSLKKQGNVEQKFCLPPALHPFISSTTHLWNFMILSSDLAGSLFHLTSAFCHPDSSTKLNLCHSQMAKSSLRMIKQKKSCHCFLQQIGERNKTIRILPQYKWGFECVSIKLFNEDFITDNLLPHLFYLQVH